MLAGSGLDQDFNLVTLASSLQHGREVRHEGERFWSAFGKSVLGARCLGSGEWSWELVRTYAPWASG